MKQCFLGFERCFHSVFHWLRLAFGELPCMVQYDGMQSNRTMPSWDNHILTVLYCEVSPMQVLFFHTSWLSRLKNKRLNWASIVQKSAFNLFYSQSRNAYMYYFIHTSTMNNCPHCAQNNWCNASMHDGWHEVMPTNKTLKGRPVQFPIPVLSWNHKIVTKQENKTTE